MLHGKLLILDYHKLLMLDWIKKNFDYLVVALILYGVIYVAYLTFTNVQPKDSIPNLRYFSSALLQVYGTIFAIGPAISLAFSSYLASRYPSQVTKRLWIFSGMKKFFIAMSGAIIICCVVLISIDSSLEEFISHLLLLELITIPVVLLTTIDLISYFFTVAGIDYILDFFRNEIKNTEKTSHIYATYHSILYKLAKDRNLTDLGAGIENLFKMILLNESIYNDVRRTLHDIERIYGAKNELICLIALDKMVDNGYSIIAESNNIELINKSSDHMSRPYISVSREGGKKGPLSFYNHHVRGKIWDQRMNQEILKIIKRLLALEINEIETTESPEIDFFVNISCFLLGMKRNVDQSREWACLERAMEIIKEMVENFSEITIQNLDQYSKDRLDNLANQLIQAKNYFGNKSNKFNRFITALTVIPNPQKGTLAHYLKTELSK